jgi:hypothetical protein
VSCWIFIYFFFYWTCAKIVTQKMPTTMYTLSVEITCHCARMLSRTDFNRVQRVPSLDRVIVVHKSRVV